MRTTRLSISSLLTVSWIANGWEDSLVFRTGQVIRNDGQAKKRPDLNFSNSMSILMPFDILQIYTV